MIYLVYPYGPRGSAPWSIGNHLGAGLRSAGLDVCSLDWEARQWPATRPGDVILGHPHKEIGRAFFGMTEDAPNGVRKIAICPYTPDHDSWLRSWLPHVDHLLAITGPHWAPALTSVAGQRATRLDMAVDWQPWPAPNPRAPGQRNFVFVGCTLPCKGTNYLASIIRSSGHGRWYHVGPGAVAETLRAGYIPLDTAGGAIYLRRTADIIVSAASFDANPTTLLEGQMLGLLAAATPTSGWGEDIATQLPVDDPKNAAAVLRELDELPTNKLLALIRERQRTIEQRYNWSNFIGAVLAHIN